MATNNKKTICVVVPAHWEAVMGGSQYQARMLIDHLLDTGNYEIHYLARHVSKKFIPQGYDVTQIASPNGIKRFGEFFDALDLYRLLKKISPDVVYQRVGCGYTGITAYYAKKEKIRSVWHVAHDREVMPYRLNIARNMAFQYVDKLFLEYGVRNTGIIVTQTQQQANFLFKYYRRKSDAVIPNTHPTAEGTLIKEDQIKVVWIANLKPWKRPEIFLRLAKDLEYMSGISFIMIGKPIGDREWCEKIIGEAGQLTNLEYLGGQPQEVVNDNLSSAHIFVNTSEEEGFANTFIQAWLRKVPVLSLSVNPDGVFDDKILGICSQSYSELKDNLLKLINDSKLREGMGHKAQLYAIEKHSYKNMQRLENIIISD